MFTIKAVTAAGVVDTFECERFTPRSFAEDKHEVILYNGTRNGSHKFGALIADIAKGDRDHAGPLRYVTVGIKDAHGEVVYLADLTLETLVEDVPEEVKEGPTLLEFVKAGYPIDKYPPQGYDAKPYTMEQWEEAKVISEKNHPPTVVPEPITFKEEAGKLIVDSFPLLALISQEAIDAEGSPFDLDEEGILSIEVDNGSAKYEPTETKDVYSLMEEDDE